MPLLVGLRDGMSGRELHAAVWAQVARLLSARPGQEQAGRANHATDCDDSLGYEFPFALRLVAGGGGWCALCAWPRLCRGCALPSCDAPLVRGCAPRAPAPARPGPAPASPAARAKLARQQDAQVSAVCLVDHLG